MKTPLKLLLFFTLTLHLTTACTNYYYIVRHAEKAATPADNPPLTQAGQQRAVVLCDSLRDKGINRIFVSQFDRTKQTAAPAAGLLGITPIEYTTTAASPNIEGLADQLRAAGDVNILVVGHTSNIPGLILNLTGIDIGMINENDFVNFFVIKRVRKDGELTYTLHRRGTYGAPSP